MLHLNVVNFIAATDTLLGAVRPTRPHRQLRAERTRARLLEAARQVFARMGYEEATVDDVASEAGCSKGAYYFHFASKHEALLALLDDWARRRADRVRTAVRPGMSLETLLTRLVAAAAGEAWEARLAQEFWLQAGRSPRLRRRLLRAYRAWRELIAPALAPLVAGPSAATKAADAVLALQDGLLVQAGLAFLWERSPRDLVRAWLSLAESEPPPLCAVG